MQEYPDFENFNYADRACHLADRILNHISKGFNWSDSVVKFAVQPNDT